MHSCLCFDDECCSYCTWFVKDILDLCCRENSLHLVGTVFHCVAEATRWKVFLAQLVGNHRFIISLSSNCLHQIPYIDIVTGICHRISMKPTIFTALKKRVSTLLTIEYSMKIRVWTNSLSLVPGFSTPTLSETSPVHLPVISLEIYHFPNQNCPMSAQGGVKQTSGGDGFEPWETSNILDHLPEGPVGTCSHNSVKSLDTLDTASRALCTSDN